MDGRTASRFEPGMLDKWNRLEQKIAALLSAEKIEDYKDFITFLICLTFSINTDVRKIAGINNRI